MDENQTKLVQAALSRYPEIGVAYLFGSRARGTEGPMSDYDFAVYASGVADSFSFSIRLGTELSEALGTDAVDVVMLETVSDPVLLREAVLLGQCVYLKDASLKQRIEQDILREYEETRYLRNVQAMILRRQVRAGVFGRPLIQSS